MRIKSFFKTLCWLVLATALIYGAGRAYFALTGGFLESNIVSELPYDPRWEIAPLSEAETATLNHVLNQEYHYLGKGCQSYVFASADGKYVIKFFKFQRFRPQWWLTPFSFIPAVEHYQTSKAERKKERLDNVFASWKIAYEQLQPETGIVYIHLNKSPNWKKSLTVYDKLGISHTLELGQLEFMVQKRATMLEDTINSLMAEGKIEEAEKLLGNLTKMLLSEYLRGIADNDHALMQNTGVLNGKPIHIDAGQFIRNDIVKNPEMYKQEMYDKTFRLKKWLQKHHPELATYLDGQLLALIGPEYFYKAPYVHKGDVGKIPNQK